MINSAKRETKYYNVQDKEGLQINQKKYCDFKAKSDYV